MDKENNQWKPRYILFKNILSHVCVVNIQKEKNILLYIRTFPELLTPLQMIK